MKKILFVLPSLCVGGLERMQVTIANALARRGFDVTILILMPDDALKSEMDERVKVIYKEPKPHPFMKKVPYVRYSRFDDGMWETRASAKSLYRYYVGEEKYDIEVGFFRGLPVKIISGSTNQNSKKFAWVHSDFLKCHWWPNFRSPKAAAKAYAKFNAVFCVSNQAEKNFHLATGQTDRVHTLYNMIPCDEILKKSEEKLDLKKERFTLLSVGHMIDVKGFDRLLAAYRRLLDGGYDLDLWLVGDGGEREKLERQAKELDLPVKFFGMQQNPYPYMKAADLYVCSSRFEGFNLTIAEALTIGMPVVSTDCTGPREILADGKYGSICENSEKGLYLGIKDLLDHPEKREAFQKAAEARGRDFDESAICNRLFFYLGISEESSEPPVKASRLLEDDCFNYYRLKFALVSRSFCFHEERQFLLERLHKAGFEAETFESFDDFKDYDPDCVMVFQPMDFPIPKDKSKIWMAFQAEQLYTPTLGGEVFGKTHLTALKPYLKAYQTIFDSSKENIKVLKQNTKARVELLTEYTRIALPDLPAKEGEPEYDLLFIGNMPGVNGRRKAILDHLSSRYKVHPIEFDLWNEKKVRAIGNAKICLNLHYDEARYEEQTRLMDYLECGAFVLSEPMYESLFEDGKDYVSFYLSELDQKIDYYLSHDEERKKFAAEAHARYLKTQPIEAEKAFHRFLDCAILESYRRELRRRDKDRPLLERLNPKTR